MRIHIRFAIAPPILIRFFYNDHINGELNPSGSGVKPTLSTYVIEKKMLPKLIDSPDDYERDTPESVAVT